MSAISNDIVGYSSQRFAGSPEAYIHCRDKEIARALGMIREAVDHKRDLKELFFQIQDVFGKALHEFAVVQDLVDARKFGRKRLEHTTGTFLCTSLDSDSNPAYNQKLLTYLKEALKNKIPINGPLPKKISLRTEECLDRKCLLEVEVLTQKEMDVIKLDANQCYDRASIILNGLPGSYSVKLGAVEEVNYPPTSEEQIFIKNFKQVFKKLKDEFPEQYKGLKTRDLFEALGSPGLPLLRGGAKMAGGNLQIPELVYIRGVVRLEINGKMYALSEFLTWTYRDYKIDPVIHLTDSCIAINHLDQFLMKDVMSDCAAVFERVVQWDRSDLENLKGRVALISYLLAYAKEDESGNEAKAEWTELLSYRYHDFKDIHHNPQKMGDLEVLTAPLWSTYHKNYLSSIKIGV